MQNNNVKFKVDLKKRAYFCALDIFTLKDNKRF